MKKLTAILLLILFFCLPISNHKIFALTLTSLSLNDIYVYPGEYDPTSDLNYGYFEKNLSILYTGSGSEKYFITFSPGDAQTYERKAFKGIYSINYKLSKQYSPPQILKELPEAIINSDVLNENLIDNYGQNNEYTEKFYFMIPQGQIIIGGLYQDTIIVKLYKGEVDKSENAQLIVTKPLHIYIYISEYLDISLSDADYLNNFPFITNFEELEENEEANFQIFVKTNLNYQINIQSNNQGYLKRDDFSSPSLIDYSFSITNQTLNLHNAQSAYFRPDSTDPLFPEKVFNVKIKITNKLTEAFAGEYNDIITYTLIAD